jgi:hypothetical protein
MGAEARTASATGDSASATGDQIESGAFVPADLDADGEVIGERRTLGVHEAPVSPPAQDI